MRWINLAAGVFCLAIGLGADIGDMADAINISLGVANIAIFIKD